MSEPLIFCLLLLGIPAIVGIIVFIIGYTRGSIDLLFVEFTWDREFQPFQTPRNDNEDTQHDD